MYFLQSERDPPHIHAIYGENVAAVDIKTDEVLEGHLSPKAMALVAEWMRMREDDLLTIWETQRFKKLPPLE